MELQRFSFSKGHGGIPIRFEIEPLDIERLASKKIVLEKTTFDVHWPAVPLPGETVILDTDARKTVSHAFVISGPPIWHNGSALIRLSWVEPVTFHGEFRKHNYGPVDC